MKQKQKKKVRAAIKHKEEKGREETPCQLLRVHPFQSNGVKKKENLAVRGSSAIVAYNSYREKKNSSFFFVCLFFYLHFLDGPLY